MLLAIASAVPAAMSSASVFGASSIREMACSVALQGKKSRRLRSGLLLGSRRPKGQPAFSPIDFDSTSAILRRRQGGRGWEQVVFNMFLEGPPSIFALLGGKYGRASAILRIAMLTKMRAAPLFPLRSLTIRIAPILRLADFFARANPVVRRVSTNRPAAERRAAQPKD